MNEHHYQRIDKGMRRQKRIVRRSEVERQARKTQDAKGVFISTYSPEMRSQIVLEAAEGLEIGIVPKEIAQKHGIPQSTLYSWLLDDETAQLARSRFFHHQIGRTLATMEDKTIASDPLELARWRDLRRAWAETAAVRDPRNYGPKQEHTLELGQSFTAALLAISKTRAERDTHAASNVINDIQDVDALPAPDPAKEPQAPE